jgi:hypothetical protein
MSQQPPRQATDMLLEFPHIDLVRGVAWFVRATGVWIGAVEAPAPDMGSIDSGSEEREVIGAAVEIRHHMAGKALTHRIELFLHQVAQVRKPQDQPLDAAGGELIEVDRQSRWFGRSGRVVVSDVGGGALQALLLGTEGHKADRSTRWQTGDLAQLADDASRLQYGDDARGIVITAGCRTPCRDER